MAAPENSAKKKYMKLKPGFFDAFKYNTPTRMAQKPEKPKSFKHEGVTEPETGIHSQAWAKAIVPQHSLLLKLPIEIRIKIWEEVIDTFKNGYKLVTPWKNGKKFKSHWWADAAKETSALYEICR